MTFLLLANIGNQFNGAIRSVIIVNINMSSVQRLMQYTRIKSEP